MRSSQVDKSKFASKLCAGIAERSIELRFYRAELQSNASRSYTRRNCAVIDRTYSKKSCQIATLGLAPGHSGDFSLV